MTTTITKTFNLLSKYGFESAETFKEKHENQGAVVTVFNTGINKVTITAVIA